jgi:DNA-binding transcriptional LysR family regulator
MQDLNDLYYFAQVVDHGGFAPAGRALQVPKSKLSRRVAALEERLGARLIQRSTRRFSVTDLGQTYHAHCKAMLTEAEAAQEAIDLSRAEPRGVVRVSCPVTLLQTSVAAMVAEFMAGCPGVSVHLQALNRPVDPIAEGFDLAIRVRRPPLQDSDLVLRVLSHRQQCLVASPALIAQLGTPDHPSALSRFPSLDRGPARHDHTWRLVGPDDGAELEVHHHPRLITDDMAALRIAAQAGVGVVHLPLMMVKRDLAQGTLVQLVPGWAPPPEIVHAVLPSKRCLLPSVRALIDHLALRFSEADED